MPSFWGRWHLKFWWIVSQIVFCCDVILLYYLLHVIFIHSRPEYFNVVSATSGAVDAVCLFQTFSSLIAFIFKSVASQMPQGRVAVRRVCVFFQHCARLCESADAQNSRQLLCIQTKALKKTNKLNKSHTRLTSPIIADLCIVLKLSAVHSSHSSSSSAVIISESC